MSDDETRAWHFYLDNMISFAEKVMAYTRGLDKAGFIGTGLIYDASLRSIELIGEAATHVPDSVRADSPEIFWRLVIATRTTV